jgi:hypothetical protein
LVAQAAGLGLQDTATLLEVGRSLDLVLPSGETVRDFLTETVLKIRDKRGRLVAFQLNKAQREYARQCTHRNIVLKARQLGITTYIASRFFLNTITRPGTVTVQVAHDQSSAEEIFRIVHRFLENLPEGLRKGALETSRANVGQIVFPRLDSEYRVETAADPNAGRGLTIHNLHCSEVARWPHDAAATLASLRAAVPPDGEVVLESTPNGAGGCFYEEWQKADEKRYMRHFLPWWWETGYRRLPGVTDFSEEEAAMVAAYGLTGEQIAFRRALRADFGKLAKQEFAESAMECFLASGECVFEVEQIEQRLAEVGEPVERRENARIEIYYPALAGREYAIGVDPAGGGSDGDYAAAQVVEIPSGLQCAELRGHYTPVELASRVEQLGHEFNDARIAVERNNHGHAVIAALEQNGYLNLYRQGGQTGWLTTSASRPRMVEQFATRLRRAPGKLESRRLLQECKTFIRKENGAASAANGAHDDLVMAMAIALATV